MEGDSSAATNLLRMLENGEGEGDLYRRVADILRPDFGDFILMESNFDSKSRKMKKKDFIADDEALLRPLAERSLPFLSGALKILRDSLLKKCTSSKGEEDELFAVYRLLLDCLSCISACLIGKQYSVHLKRYWFIFCLETRGRFSQAQDEGFALLERLVSIASPAACSGSSFLPDPTNKDSSCDEELVVLIVELVLTLIRCTYKSKKKSDASYRRILTIAGEIHPWLGFLDSESYNNYHLLLVKALFKCSLFLAEERTSFAPELIHSFSLEMSRQWLISSSKDRFPKVACEIFSSVLVSWDGRFALMLEILEYLLDFILCKCKDNTIEHVNEFLDFVHYVADSLIRENSSFLLNAYELLHKRRSNLHKVSVSVASILGFYVVGLAFGRISQLQSSNNELGYVQIFGDSLSILVKSFDHKDTNFSHYLSGCLQKLSYEEHEPKRACPYRCMHGDVSFFSFLDALAFLCNQLDVYVTSAWKDMMSGKRVHLIDEDFVLDAFHQFCSMFLHNLHKKSYTGRLLERRVVLFHVVVASMKFSILTSKDCERIIAVIRNLITCDWIKMKEMKYLASSFYNIGALLYNVGQVGEASIVLRLYCTISWTHMKSLGQLHEDYMMTKEAIHDAFSKSACALYVVHKWGNKDFHELAIDCLLSWSVIEDQLEISASPYALVKQWVKIICKDFKNVDAKDSLPSLSLRLQNKNSTLPKKIFGAILEQELLAYEEYRAEYPNVFQKMQPTLLDTLIEKVYIGDEHLLQRSKLLIKKGIAIRTFDGVIGLKNSLECFSRAISYLKIACDAPNFSGNYGLLAQLKLAYFLHARFTLEANGLEKVILKDVISALSRWYQIILILFMRPRFCIFSAPRIC